MVATFGGNRDLWGSRAHVGMAASASQGCKLFAGETNADAMNVATCHSVYAIAPAIGSRCASITEYRKSHGLEHLTCHYAPTDIRG